MANLRGVTDVKFFLFRLQKIIFMTPYSPTFEPDSVKLVYFQFRYSLLHSLNLVRASSLYSTL